MIDRKWIGHDFGSAELPIERGRLKFFAKAIGETNPIYTDEVAAGAAGYSDLPAPPTFLFSAELDAGTVFDVVAQMGVKLEQLLHGEQSFSYHAPVVAGDVVTVTSRVSDIFDKKGGALQFIVKDGRAVNQRGEHVADMRSILVVRS
jgi:acyl dehydratase